MDDYDFAKACELIVAYLLWKLQHQINLFDMRPYRDDSLMILRRNNAMKMRLLTKG